MTYDWRRFVNSRPVLRAYGVNVFCYYYYWFNGRRILERPLNEVQRTGRPDFPFMICWANEPWTRNWDGLSRDVLLAQTYHPGWTILELAERVPAASARRPRGFRADLGRMTSVIAAQETTTGTSHS
jgi:lipopolysaccharide biosynthesis protein